MVLSELPSLAMVSTLERVEESFPLPALSWLLVAFSPLQSREINHLHPPQGEVYHLAKFDFRSYTGVDGNQVDHTRSAPRKIHKEEQCGQGKMSRACLSLSS